MRTRERVREIDSTIKQYYPQYGAAYVAGIISEDVKYISGRAAYLKVKRSEKPGVMSPVEKELRLELIKMTDKNLKLKGEFKEALMTVGVQPYLRERIMGLIP